MNEKLQLLLKLNKFNHKLLCELNEYSKGCSGVPVQLKLRIEVNGIKHKLLIDSQECSNGISFDGFKNAMRTSYKEFEQYFDEKRFILEVFDKDFEEYIKLSGTDFIDNKSKLRVIRIEPQDTQRPAQAFRVQDAANGNVDSNESTTSTSVNSDVDIDVSQVPLLSLDSHPQTENERNIEHLFPRRVNPSSSESNLLFSRNNFLTERSLSITCGEPNHQVSYEGLNELGSTRSCSELCKTDSGELSSKDDRSPLQEINNNVKPKSVPVSIQVEPKSDTEVQPESPPVVMFADKYAHQYIGKQSLPVSNFIVRNFNKKRALAAAVRKHTKLFLKHSQHASSVWKKVRETLASADINFTSEECRHMFSGLLGQYICILKNLMEFTVDEAQTIWPLFKMFHFSFNLKPFKNDIISLRELFNNYSKTKEVGSAQSSSLCNFANSGDMLRENDVKAEYNVWDPWRNDWPPLRDDWTVGGVKNW